MDTLHAIDEADAERHLDVLKSDLHGNTGNMNILKCLHRFVNDDMSEETHK